MTLRNQYVFIACALQFKNVEQHRAHEEEEEKATVEKLKKLEIENGAQVGKIAELEQQVRVLPLGLELRNGHA